MSRTWVDAGEPFGRLFNEFTRSAWRWECQGTYHESDEVEPWARWRAGVRDNSWIEPWTEAVRAMRRQGKTFRRVRMLTEPLTDYLRWMLDVTPANIAAGEDIRWTTKDVARDLGMPSYDFYLFDDERLAILHFGEHGVSGADLVDDADVVARHLAWRAKVWQVAISHDQYVRQHSERSP